jgi:hypothetical protein
MAGAASFSGQFREARENALRDSEAFDGIVHVVERLGSFLCKSIIDLGRYREKIEERAGHSALARRYSQPVPRCSHSFLMLYELVRSGRNDAPHQGAFACGLTTHAIEPSLVLEEALRPSVESPVVSDYMTRNPLCAELWQSWFTGQARCGITSRTGLGVPFTLVSVLFLFSRDSLRSNHHPRRVLWLSATR